MPEDKKIEGEGENEGEQQQQKKGLPKIVIFIAAGVVVLGIAVLVLVKFVFAPPQEKTVPAGETAQGEQKPFSVSLFSFDQAVIVNLAESNGQRYLKINLQLEMNAESLRPELEARKPQIMDLIISILSSKTLEDVTSTVGRNRLKRELIDRINAELVTGKIVNIYFTEFVIQ